MKNRIPTRTKNLLRWNFFKSYWNNDIVRKPIRLWKTGLLKIVKSEKYLNKLLGLRIHKKTFNRPLLFNDSTKIGDKQDRVFFLLLLVRLVCALSVWIILVPLHHAQWHSYQNTSPIYLDFLFIYKRIWI